MNERLFSSINDVYNDIYSSGYIGSIKKLYDAARKINNNVKIRDVKEYLKTKDSYTLHKQQPNKFKRRAFLTSGPGVIICADVGFFKNLSKWNDGVNYVLFIIDMFSKYLSCFHLKSLKSGEMVHSFNSFFEESVFNYTKLCVDNGVEFYSNEITKIFRKNNIHRYSTCNRDIKVAVAERVIRTIKTNIYKHLTKNNTNRYIDKLQDIVLQYNIIPHMGILGNIPINVHLNSSSVFLDRLRRKIYKRRVGNMKSVSTVLARDTYVRIKSALATQHKFKKAYAIRNTTEIFKIRSVNLNHFPITYFISDLSGNPISGCFYKQELIEVKLKDAFKIEILKTRKRKDSVELKVRYIDYPNEKPVWIDENNILQCKD